MGLVAAILLIADIPLKVPVRETADHEHGDP
jgi:hypothetical protein